MAKDPAFLFYSSDFLSGITDLTMEERGQYITLLCLQHQKGLLTPKAISITVPNCSTDVLDKFQKDEKGNYFNERLEEEREKRKKHSNKQRERALSGWKKRKDKEEADATADAPANATALPLEDVNVNESESIVKTETVKEVKYHEYVYKCFDKCLEHFPIHLHPTSESKKESWLQTIDKLRRIEKIQYAKILEIVKKTRNDDFWAKNFLSLTKLRKKNKDGLIYLIVFNEQIKSNEKRGNNNNGTVGASGVSEEYLQGIHKRISANANVQNPTDDSNDS